MSLLCLISIGCQLFLNELCRELCTSRGILGGLYGNASEFVKLIVKPDFPGVEVTGTELSTTTGIVIFTDECKVDIGYDSRVFSWRKVGEDWMPCCLAQPPKPKFNLMIWGCVTFNSVGTITVVDGNINSQKYYIDIIDEHLWPVVA